MHRQEMKDDLKKFFKEKKTCKELDEYKEWFNKNKDGWMNCGSNPSRKLFTLFLENYVDCHKDAGVVRGKLVPFLYNLLEDPKPADFLIPWSQFTSKAVDDGFQEDYPHLKTSLATMMFGCISELGFKFEDFVFSWNEDKDYAEEQVFTYKDIQEELKKMFESDGKLKISNKIAESKKNLKVPE